MQEFATLFVVYLLISLFTAFLFFDRFHSLIQDEDSMEPTLTGVLVYVYQRIFFFFLNISVFFIS